VRSIEERVVRWLLDWGWMAVAVVTLAIVWIWLITAHEPFAGGLLR